MKNKICFSFIVLACVASSAYALTLKNVTAPANIPTYYQSLNEKSGSSLTSVLKTITATGFSSLGYDGLWEAYPYTDVYPSDSTDKKGLLWDMYGACAFDPSSGPFCGNYNVECDCVNREHSIPKSWWGGDKNNMYSDIFHLVPTDGYVNNRRSAYAFGVVSGTPSYQYNGCKLGTPSAVSTDKKTIAEEAGTSVSPSGISTVFEPQDQYKGDFARGYLGMIAHYYGDYTITSAAGSSMFSSSYTAGSNWGLTDYGVTLLMKWHREDPVSQKEIDRNNGIQKTQGNRNPFIDYPYLAEYIWGEHAGEAVDMSLLMPSSDAEFIPGVSDGWRGNSDDPNITVSATSVTLDKTNNGATSTKTFTVTGANLMGDISIAKTGSEYITVSPTTISAANANTTQTITITYKPKAEGTHTATLTISSTGANNKTVAITGTCATVYTATWMADDSEWHTSTAESGDSPAVPNNPADCSEDRVFKGWTLEATYTSEDGAGLFTTTAPTISENTTFYAVYADKEGTGSGSSDEFELYSGELTEGDYIIYYNGKAMNSTVSSNRLGYTEVTSSDDKITTTDDAIIWHIAASGNYWTIYNAGEAKYAAATGTKNQAGLNADGTDDKSLWTASGSSTYEFVNKNNAANSVNANLRNNGSYGFACYATSTGGALSLYKAAASASYSNYSTECTSTPKVTITFHANNGSGETTTQQVPQGLSRALNANTFAYEHHTFLGWATTEHGDKEYDNKQTINISADLDLYAVWQEYPQFTATFMNNGVPYATRTGFAGETFAEAVTNPTPCKEDFTFVGWVTSPITEATTINPSAKAVTTYPAEATTYHAVYKWVEGDAGSGSSDKFELYSGDLTEGDYIIYYDGKAMKSTVSSNRLSYAEIAPSEDVITTTDAEIIWHIAASGNYWTIYNAGVAQYAAATGTKNQAGLNADGTDDKSLWTVSGTETYEFVNKNNAANSVNANLRNNGSYGFACYSSSTGGALSLYKNSGGSSSTTYYATSPDCGVQCEATITITSNNEAWGTVSFVDNAE